MKKYPLLYCFFIMVLSITIIDIFKSDKKFSELENRNLKTKTEFSVKKYIDGTFQNKYEEYMSDQFLLRDSWIDLKSRSEFVLGKLENNNIIYGKENYLFEKFIYLDEHRVDVNVNSINKLIENVNTNVTTMIVPNSYEIYEENVPSSAPLIDIESELDSIYSKINSSNNINLIDIMKNNKEKDLFYKTDHHWSSDGAYAAYSAFMNSIGKEPIKLEDYNKNTVSDFYGTYYSKAKPFNNSGDDLSYYDFSGITMEINDEIYDSLYDYSKLEIRDKYSLFLYGNNPLTVIKNTNLKNGEKLCIFKDSYANSMVPFLTQNFEEIHVIDLRSFSSPIKEYINENNFNDVLILYNFINFTRDANIIKLKS